MSSRQHFAPALLVGLIIPTGICMAWVAISEYNLAYRIQPVRFSILHVVDDSTTEAKISNAVVISLGFVGVVVTWTFLMILCIWQNCDRLLNGFLALSSLLATSLLSFTYARIILMMTSIFLMGPQTLQQISMVVGSGLIAIAFLRLPYSAYFVWSVLVIMSFYDIIAVLSPCGPLKILIKTIQNGGKLPMGLIYSVRNVNMIDEPKDREAIELEEIDRVQNKTPEDPVRGSQLGLGDFVFYSLLVGQVIVSTGFFAALATYVTVEMGLITVSVLVVLYDQPLPALPISVLVALLVTFIYSHCADPFAQLRELNQIHI